MIDVRAHRTPVMLTCATSHKIMLFYKTIFPAYTLISPGRQNSIIIIIEIKVKILKR